MDTLFHYATAAGLLGILSSSTLWATDLRFLNDAQEALYARDLFMEMIWGADPATQPGHPLHDNAKAFGETFVEYRKWVAKDLNSPKFPVYVTCFCESGDLLSQWRAYGTDHGYAIGVKPDVLKTAIQQVAGHPTEMKLIRVRYGREAAADVVSDAMRDMGKDTNLGHLGVHAYFMALHLTGMLAGVKHPGFQEEREWRVVGTFESEPELVQFRSTPMAIVPYIEIPLPKEAIATIRVGPGRHVDVREAGLRRLLTKVDCDVPVVHSEVPLRT